MHWQAASRPLSVPQCGVLSKQRTQVDLESTFVPPHELSLRDSVGKLAAGSHLSATPAGSSGRDKLRARNAVFAVTGFMEGHVNLPMGGRVAAAPRTAGGLSHRFAAADEQAAPLSAPEAARVLA